MSTKRPFLTSLLLVGATYLSTPSFGASQDPCIQVGGIRLDDRTCACRISQRSIDPRREDCLSETVTWMNRFLAAQDSPPCPEAAGSNDSHTGRRADAEPAFCGDPVRQLCDTGRNPALRMLREAQKQYDSALQEAYRSPDLAPYAQWTCRSYRDEARSQCYQQLSKALEPKLYTKDRKVLAEDIFEDSRRQMIRVLEERVRYFRARPDHAKTVDYLERSIVRIRKAELKFDPEAGFGATAHSMSRSASKIALGGLVLVADTNPYILYKTFLHELGHLAALNASFISDGGERLPYDPVFPFDREMRCLIPDSQKSDADCFERLGKLSQDPAEFISADWRTNLPKLYENLATEARRNPYLALNSPWPNLNRGCPPAKHEEALADLLAAEAFSKTLEPGNEAFTRQKNRARIDAMTALLCTEVDRSPALHQAGMDGSRLVSARRVGKSSLFEGADMDAHPSEEFRINRILTAHPKVRQALGCPSDGYEVPLDSPQGQDEFTPRYCGLGLYGGSTPAK